jgi:cytoskeleton protein RodZ
MSIMDGSGTTETNRVAGGGLAEIGAMLRRRREEIGQDLVTIASTTHIRLNYLKAIEDGRQRDLPGTAYMIGYIRTYADHLGFDGNRLISDFHAELAGQRKLEEKRAEAAGPPSPGLPQIQISPAILMAAVLVLGIAVYGAWNYVSSEEEPTQAALVQGPTQDGLAPAAPPAAKPASPSPTGAEASAPSPQVQPAPVIPPAPAAAVAPEPTAEDQMPPEAELASAAEEPAEDPAAEEPAPADADADAKAGKIVVRARLESWIQVTNAKKDVLFSRVLRAGETYTVPDENGLLLTTGNAGGIEILVNGKKLKSFGTVGLVKRDIALDPKKLKDGSAFKTTSRD